MHVLNRDEILGADDLKTEKVPVPEWGGFVYIRTMTGEERDSFETDFYGATVKDEDEGTTRRNFRAKLVCRCAVDESGERIFTDADAEALGRKSAPALDRLWPTAKRLNALTQEDEDELVKN
jgi:hypothetical protein